MTDTVPHPSTWSRKPPDMDDLIERSRRQTQRLRQFAKESDSPESRKALREWLDPSSRWL